MADPDKDTKKDLPADAQAHAYRSEADPRKREGDGAVKDNAQAQSGSGFKDGETRPKQDSDWYGVRRPDPAGSGNAKADPAHLAAAAATRKPS